MLTRPRALVSTLLVVLAAASGPSGAGPAGGAQRATADPNRFDVVVYGGTAAGVLTAVTAAREGLTVALLEPGRHLGGMVSGGLGWLARSIQQSQKLRALTKLENMMPDYDKSNAKPELIIGIAGPVGTVGAAGLIPGRDG